MSANGNPLSLLEREQVERVGQCKSCQTKMAYSTVCCSCAKDIHIDSAEARISQLQERVEEVKAENTRLRENTGTIVNSITEERDQLQERIHGAMEVYAGMDGFMPETAAEAYCMRIIEQMYAALLPPTDREPG